MEYWIDTIKEVLLHPRKFFKKLKTKSYKEPLMFYIANVGIYAILETVLRSFWSGSSWYYHFIDIPFILLGAYIALFLRSAVIMMGMKMIGGKGNYKDTTIALAYTSATKIFSWIPGINILAGIYGFILGIIAISNVHKTTIGKTVLGVLLGSLVILAILLVGIVLGASFMYIAMKAPLV